MTKKKKYNLFLDDLRVPYISKEKSDELNLYGKDLHFASAYEYTHYEPFKVEPWTIVRDYNQFVNTITVNGLPNKVAFDHDLADIHYSVQSDIDYDFVADEEKTGYHAVKWLCDYCQDNNLKFPEHIVISWNPVGKENIEKYIENYKKHIENNI